ncbi:hypothetical protein LSAT2_017262 [Lamellibrachia satsuma]|nr:hypothetical protein LSAT2_017262 [Lamellibrachia satsuma]
MDADDDSDVQVEVEEEMDETEVHPTSLDNKAPAFLIQHYQTAVVFLQNYGWYIVFVVIILIILKNRLEPYLRRVSHQMEQQRELHVDPDVAERRLEAMEAHRRRLQEEFDAKAARFAEEQKKKEEDRRKAKIEDWDRHLMGEGYRSRTRQGVTPNDIALCVLRTGNPNDIALCVLWTEKWTGVLCPVEKWTGVLCPVEKWTEVLCPVEKWMGVLCPVEKWMGVLCPVEKWTGVLCPVEKWTEVLCPVVNVSGWLFCRLLVLC